MVISCRLLSLFLFRILLVNPLTSFPEARQNVGVVWLTRNALFEVVERALELIRRQVCFASPMVGLCVVCVDFKCLCRIVNALFEEIEIEVDHGSVAVRLCVGIVPLESQCVLLFGLLELALDVELVSFNSRFI